MWGRFFSCFGQAEDNGYQLVPANAVEPAQDNSELFNKLPIEMIVRIASFLPQEDLIPFFLTNQKTLRAFEDFAGNIKQDTLRVYMPTSRYSLYQGAQAQVSFRDVNHVLMAQYMQRQKLQNIEDNKHEIDERAQKRECMVMTASITTGVVVGVAIQVGMAAFMDQVCLPYCSAVDMANNNNLFATCPCAGDICRSTVPDLGTYMGRPVVDPSLCWYRFEHILWCYTFPPMIPSCAAGWGLGGLPTCYPISECVLLPYSAHMKYDVNRTLRSLDSSRNENFADIFAVNQRLREHKVDGAAYRMFAARVAMVDEPAQVLPPAGPAPEAANPAPGRMMME